MHVKSSNGGERMPCRHSVNWAEMVLRKMVREQRMVAVLGNGTVGKTALAVQVHPPLVTKTVGLAD